MIASVHLTLSLSSGEQNGAQSNRVKYWEIIAGNLSEAGWANIDGTVFEITPQSTFTKLHDFNGSDGADPLEGWSKPPKGTLTEQPMPAAPTGMAPCSAWAWAWARLLKRFLPRARSEEASGSCVTVPPSYAGHNLII